MTPAEFFSQGIRSPPTAISEATRPVSICTARRPPPRDTYTLRRLGAKPLYLTRELLACFYDLTIRQAGWALRTCDTAIKRLRIWARAANWPCKEVRAATHPQHSLDSIRRARWHFIEATREAQPEMHAALLRAEELHPTSGGGVPAGVPSDWLDALDAPNADAPDPDACEREDLPPAAWAGDSGADDPGPEGPAVDWGDLGLEGFDPNQFELACADPFWTGQAYP